MKLDPRIETEFNIFTPFSKNTTNLKGKGFFSNTIRSFSNLKNCMHGTLAEYNLDLEYPYLRKGGIRYAFFIPSSLLKRKQNKEKKYRPYTLMEFTDEFTVGQPIKFRQKGAVGCEQYMTLTGYVHEQRNDQTITYIYIGPRGYTLQELFEEYEWQKHYTEDFEPFGVEE